MALHIRRQICAALGSALTGLTTTGSNVFLSRVYPLADANLPALLIYVTSDSVDTDSMTCPRPLHRILRVEVSAVAKATATLDATLDEICRQVEVALAMPVTALNGLAKSSVLVATDIELTGSAEQPTGRARMTYEVDYYAAENAPDVAL